MKSQSRLSRKRASAKAGAKRNTKESPAGISWDMAKAVNREIGYAVIAKCPADPNDMEEIKKHVYFYRCRHCGGVFLNERKFK